MGQDARTYLAKSFAKGSGGTFKVAGEAPTDLPASLGELQDLLQHVSQKGYQAASASDCRALTSLRLVSIGITSAKGLAYPTTFVTGYLRRITFPPPIVPYQWGVTRPTFCFGCRSRHL